MTNQPLPTPTPPKPPAPASGQPTPSVTPTIPASNSGSSRTNQSQSAPAGLVEAGESPTLVAAPVQPPQLDAGTAPVAAKEMSLPQQTANQTNNKQPNQPNPGGLPKPSNGAYQDLAAAANGQASKIGGAVPKSPSQFAAPKQNQPAPGSNSNTQLPKPPKPGVQPPKPGALPPKPGGQIPKPNPVNTVVNNQANNQAGQRPVNQPKNNQQNSNQPNNQPRPSNSMPTPKAPAGVPKPPEQPGQKNPVGQPPQLPPRPGVPLPSKPTNLPPQPGGMPPKPPINQTSGAGSVPPALNQGAGITPPPVGMPQPPKQPQQPQQPLTMPPQPVGSSKPVAPVMPPRPVGPPGPPVPPPTATQPPVPPAGGAGTPPVPPPSAAKPAVPAARFASIRQSPFKLLPIILGALALIGVIVFAVTRLLGGSARQPAGSSTTTPSNGGGTGNRTVVPAQQTTLVYWGLWEPSEVLTEVFDEFEAANPGIQVEYTKQSHVDYRERLQTAIASGKGPDLFRYHASWTPMLKNELAPVPSSVISAADFQKLFYPVAYKQLQVNGQLTGVPLMYDGLALYYNKEMLRNANAQPPQTWAELRTLATQLTIRSGETIQRGGLAIGNASNVEHFSDIIALLMLQNGANLTQPTSAEARDALLFYTNFAKVDKVWSDTLPSSTVAFARGDVAMMFAPSWRAHEIEAQNPNLEFAIAPLPKLGDNKVTWATYWAEGVNAQGKNKDAAWKLLQYLSSSAVMKKMHSDQSEVRSFGELYSRADLANDLASQPLAAPYLADAPTAEGWYLSSYTHDNGINDQLIKYYQDAVNAVLGGKKIEDVLTTLNQGTSQVLRQYGVTVSSGATGGTP